MRQMKIAATVAGALSAALMATSAGAAEITVIGSTAMTEFIEAVIPIFEHDSGHKVKASFLSGSVLPVKVKEGAPADLIVTTPESIDDLVKAGKVVAGSRVDFVRSSAGVAVRAGAPKPDISTPEAFKHALLAAKSVGISKGPSGFYMLSLLERLGIADAVKAKAVIAQGRPVGDAIASGEAEIGVQQVAELRPIAGTEVIGEMPGDLQKQIPYSAGIPTKAKNAETARALVSFLRSEAALDVLKRKGMDVP